jgi:6-phosphogluconolactonase (cycloisomerase 2 family)
MIVDNKGKFLYLTNQGPNLTESSPASTVSAFFIDQSTGRLTSLSTGANATSTPFGSGSDPRCIVEDPSNQYIYTANYSDSTVTGAIINTSTGTLTTLRKNNSFKVTPQPTWCVFSGTLF